MKQEIQALRERVNYLEEKWTATTIVDCPQPVDLIIPIKCMINPLRREIIFLGIDKEYIRNKRKMQKQKENEQQRLRCKSINYTEKLDVSAGQQRIPLFG